MAGQARRVWFGKGSLGHGEATQLTRANDYEARIGRIEQDAIYFASMGVHALPDADLLLVELTCLAFEDVADVATRSKLQRLRDDAVVSVSRAIEDAE